VSKVLNVVFYAIVRIGKRSYIKRANKMNTKTTFSEELSYIGITLRETVSIVFHRFFHRVSDRLWKTRYYFEMLKKMWL